MFNVGGRQTRFLIFLIFIANAIKTISAAKVLVVAPKLFRCNEEERILITAFDISNQRIPFQVVLEHSTHGNLISDQKIHVSKDRPGMVNLTVTLGDLANRMSSSSDPGEESHYVTLIITSQIFNKRLEIPVELNTGYIFIQTDKPIYNPAQTVKIRIVSLNEHMLPAKSPLTFSIKNPRGLILYSHQFKISRPFINTTYELTEHPPLGNWTITAQFANGMKTRAKTKFLVQKYMLPVFEVKIQVEPQFIVRSTQIVTVTTTARYLYGKPVKGEVKLRYSYGLMSLQDEGFQELTEGTVMTNIRLPVIQVPINTPFNVTAEVIETNSGISEDKQDVSAKFVISPYKFDVSDSQTFFKPGLPYTVNVETLYANGSSAPNVPFYLEYTAITRSNRREYFKQLYENPTSFKQCVIRTSRFWTQFTIKLISADQRLDSTDQIKEQWLVSASKSETDTYLLLSLNTTIDGFTVGDFITMQVATSRIYYNTPLYYMIIGKSKILKYDILPYTQGTWRISFQVTSDMIPMGRVIAYYARRTEVVADSRSFKVLDICAAPELRLSTAPQRRVHHPMTNVEIQLKGSPHATVGLSAVDKAVFLINDKNRLTRKFVKKIMMLGDLACSPGGGLNVGQVFYDAGFIISTGGLSRTPVPERGNMLCSLKQIASQVTFGRYRRTSDFCCMSGELHQGSDCKVAWQQNTFRKSESCRISFMQCCARGQEVPTGKIHTGGGDVDEPYEGGRRGPVARFGQQDEYLSPVFSHYFPESELFQEYQLNPSGQHKLNFTLPDSLTSWHIQGLSLGDTSPFCVSNPISLTTFKDVITKLNFPNVVKRLEQIHIKAVVYNYKTYPINVKVHFHETKGICSHAAPKKPFRVQLTIPAQDIGVAKLVIVPLKAGNFTIRIEVYEVESNTLEIIEKVLRVKYEGVKKTKSLSLMLDPSGAYSRNKRYRRQIFEDVTIPKNEISISQRTQRIIMNLTQPAEAIEGSAKGDIVITGNILGSTIQTSLKEPHKLLEKPYGCGEQTMIHLAPCVYILSYLNSTKQGTPEIYENATRNIRLGVLREQEFRKMDGSYAAFDQNPSSVWLTAFVVKVFCQASEFEHIDPHLTKSAMTWLFQSQRLDGSFVESHPVIHQEMLGGVADDGMTAFVLISLMECGFRMHPEEIHRRRSEIDLAIRHLEHQMDMTYDSYNMAILSYALALADSPRKYDARRKLRTLAVENYGKDYLYWKVGGSSNLTEAKVSAWYHTEESYLSVEATAYALLTELHYGEVEEVGPIIKWLVEQRNTAGMFKSTQDTVMALQALAEYGIKTNTPDINLFFNLTSSRAHLHKHLAVNKETSLWSHVIPDVPINDEVLIESMGIGSAQMELNMWYYRPPTKREICHFNVTHVITPIRKDIRRLIKKGCPLCGEPCPRMNGPILKNWDVNGQTICMKIYLRYLGTTNPGMVVLDMDILTGYDTHEELLEQLKRDGVIAKYYKHDNEKLTLYFNTIPFTEELEIKLLLFRPMIIPNRLMPAPIHVFVYYNATESCTKFYQLSREKDLINLLCDSSKKVCKCAQRECVACYERMSEWVKINLNLLEKKNCVKEQVVMIVNMTSTFDSSGTAHGFVLNDLSKTNIQELENREAIFQRGICDCPHVRVGDIFLLMSNKRVRTLDEHNQFRHKFWVDSSGLMINKNQKGFVKEHMDIFETKARSLSRRALCGHAF